MRLDPWTDADGKPVEDAYALVITKVEDAQIKESDGHKEAVILVKRDTLQEQLDDIEKNLREFEKLQHPEKAQRRHGFTPGAVPSTYSPASRPLPLSCQRSCFALRVTIPFYRSINGGATWTVVPNVLDVSTFGFGAAAAGQSYPAIYIVGYVDNVFGIWQSVNNAQSWTSIGTFPTGARLHRHHLRRSQ